MDVDLVCEIFCGIFYTFCFPRANQSNFMLELEFRKHSKYRLHIVLDAVILLIFIYDIGVKVSVVLSLDYGVIFPNFSLRV